MRHVYPPRHPAWLDAKAQGQATPAREQVPEPAPPHERDQADPGQAGAAVQAGRVGRKARGKASGRSADRGPEKPGQ